MSVAFGVSTAPALTPSSTTQVARSAALDGSTVIELVVGQAFQKVGLARLKIKRVSGTAANFTPIIFSAAGVTTAGAIQQEFAGSSTAVATLFDPSLDPLQNIMRADQNGKLYLIIGPDAGADNVFDYCARFVVFQ